MSGEPPPIRLSERAAAELLRATAAGGGTPRMRISVVDGGCEGLRYELELAEEEGTPGPRPPLQHGVELLWREADLAHVRGLVIDFEAERGFVLRNPLATRTCACGASFSTTPLDGSPSEAPAEDCASPEEFTRPDAPPGPGAGAG